MIKIKNREDINGIADFLKSRRLDFAKFEDTVKRIIEDVKNKGDSALFEYTRRFDGFDANKESIIVKQREIEEAKNFIPDEHKEIIKCAAERIEKFHRAFLPKSSFVEEDGVILGNRVTPVSSAGLYIPGGKAAYPSTALMTIIPAVVAGVKNIQIATPSKGGEANPYVLYIADLYGIEKVYKVGGAQAIAAFAYSTETIEKVDVVAGPGNIYVAIAKKLVFGDVGIDSIAGPSEVMVVADESANVEYIAKDLLSQAEHDEMAGCFFVGLNEKLTLEVERRFFELSEDNPRADITKESAKNAFFAFVEDIELAAELVDLVAPEHLEIQLEEPYLFINRIRNAGAIFVGEFTPEPIGDYVAGPNHTLPTSQTARFFSPLSCETFMKKSSLLHFSKKGFLKVAKCASEFAEIEGLFAHKGSIDVRYKYS
ncbi:histidinol dehydrogenase [Hippea alviniae]|uniref:histidinol dehydrogenase n=1 Tax=Hippea alviniae TaxID=1279027 RepID=UPI0003B73282|nr:histidinol dehydrogenase [Hippea alviniae]